MSTQLETSEPTASRPTSYETWRRAVEAELRGAAFDKLITRTPEGIAALIARMDQIEPFLSPEDDEAWRKALAEQRAFEKANWERRANKIGELFE